MSVVDHFDKAPEAGFSRGPDAESARRQFNVSLGLIAALACAAGLLAFTLRGEGPKATSTAAASRTASMIDTSSGTSAYGALVRP
jgi:hypothetical protein